MAYIHLENLYKNNSVLQTGADVYALEKIHGTSAHVSWHPTQGLRFSAGGGKHETFVAMFDEAKLKAAMGDTPVVVFGEYYGGSMQRMSVTYGPVAKFVAFDVKIGDVWLSVPEMNEFCAVCGIEAVDWRRVPATVEAVNEERDRDSVQAVRNGMGEGKIREGVVIRPIVEAVDKFGSRIMAKHKRAEFAERGTVPEVDPVKLQVLTDARTIADEWVVPMRLEHVLQRFPGEVLTVKDTRRVIDAMIEDVRRESAGEVVWSSEVGAAIARKASALFAAHIKRDSAAPPEPT